jgi:hypothetical protein
LDKGIFQKVKNIIRNDTGLGDIRIGGVELYTKLTAAGVEVPELAIAEILEQLAKEKLIELERQVNPEDKEKHGTYVISWVSRQL